MCKDLKSFFNPFCLLFKKMFYRSNLNKVIFIFTFGLISRTFINNIYNVNVFSFVVRILISMNIRIFHYKLEDIKISSTSYVKKFFKYLGYFYNRNKAITYYNQTNTS